jgi:hypothetical protein
MSVPSTGEVIASSYSCVRAPLPRSLSGFHRQVIKKIMNIPLTSKTHRPLLSREWDDIRERCASGSPRDMALFLRHKNKVARRTQCDVAATAYKHQ